MKDKKKITELEFSILDSSDEGIIVHKPIDGKVKIEFNAEGGYTDGYSTFDLKELFEFLKERKLNER